MSHSRLWAVAAAVAGVVGLATWLSCDRDGADGGAVAAAPLGEFVGGDRCGECHRPERELWLGSHHDLAMQEVNQNTVLGDFGGVEFTHFGTTSEFYRDGDRFMVRTDGPDGELADYPIRYVFGVTPLQQYLVEFPFGRLQALPLCWDTRPREQGGQRWFHLYPDEAIPHDDELHWTGRNQNWNYMCAACHSTNLRKNYDAASDSYATSWSEIDVSCEACHGPGSKHVAWAEAGGSGGDPMPRIGGGAATWELAPGAVTAMRQPPLEGHRELEVCAPCHSRRGAMGDDQVAGHFLDQYRPALLEQGLYFADGQIDDEVYVYGSFVQSRMYHRGVTCSDCHEPHSLRLRAAGNALCTRCHQAAEFDTPEHHLHAPDSVAAACVECHMPSRTYMVVDPRRDHSLRIPRPDLSVSLGTPNACNGCHDDRSPQWAADAIAAARPAGAAPPPRHFAAALQAGRRGAVGAEQQLIATITDPAQPAIARATALTLLARMPSADVLRAAITDPDPLVRTASVSPVEMLPPAKRPMLVGPLLLDPVRLVRTEAALALAELPARELPAPLRQPFAAAVSEYVAAQQFNADQPWSHLNLGLLYTSLGGTAKAENAYRWALQLDPSFVQAYANLADLYRAQQRDDLAEDTLRQGLRMAADSPELSHALGLTLVRRGNVAEAIDALATAARLRPENPRFGYMHAVALDSVGETQRALAVLDRAHQRHPGDTDIMVALVTYARREGQLERAIGYARELVKRHPEAAEAQQLLRELETERGR